MKIYCKVALIFCLLFTTTVFGSPNTTTLLLTIINNTNTTFIFGDISGQNPGNVFSINVHTIAPHATAILTGTITKDTDLTGILHIYDTNYFDSLLMLLDPRNIHVIQPLFTLHNQKYSSAINSETRGDPTTPRGLLITEATVSITNQKQH